MPAWCALVAWAALVGGPVTASAQEAPPPPTAPPTAVEIAPPRPNVPSPGGAFLRSLVVPGWGHAAIGAYGRGAFYVVTESATAWMLIRTRLRLSEARDRVATRERVVRASLEAEGVTDPTELQTRIAADPGVSAAGALVESRESQQEDWVALGIFLMLLSGADAYISSHLAHFPDPIEVGVVPAADGGIALAVKVPVRGP